MARPPKRDREASFLAAVEATYATAPHESTPIEVGESLGFDSLEVTMMLTWLFSQRLVMIASGELADPYTDEPLKVTRRGEHYLRTGQILAD